MYVMQFELKFFVCYTIHYHKLKVKEIITLDQHCFYVLRADLSTGDHLCPEIEAFSQKRLEQKYSFDSCFILFSIKDETESSCSL